MPIISRVGRRSWKVRVAYGLILLSLMVGALTMVYPLLLMLTGSVMSEADLINASPLPRYLWNDDALWQKTVESKYGTLRQAELAYRRPLNGWLDVKPPAARTIYNDEVTEFEVFRASFDWPKNWYVLGFTTNVRLFRQVVQERFAGNVGAYADAIGAGYRSWQQVVLPVTGTTYASRVWSFPDSIQYDLYDQFKAIRPRSDWVLMDPDAVYWATFLLPQWPTIRSYNAWHGTRFTDYNQVLLRTTPPADKLERKDWETFVRTSLNLLFVRIASTPEALAGWRGFLAKRYGQSLADLNTAWGTRVSTWTQVEFPSDLASAAPRLRADLNAFVRDAEACPLSALSIDGPRQRFAAFLAARHGIDIASIGEVPLPTEAMDWKDLQNRKLSLRWEFLTANFCTVFDYLLLHGNGFRNTAIYCLLAVLTHLLVNPLAAYALSRFKPPGMYGILLFCMLTMAFPYEVTMIPAFLLLKSFPLLPIVLGFGTSVVVAWLSHLAWPTLPAGIKGVVAGTIGIVAGYWLSPLIAQRLFGLPQAEISLLNTFWALILPGMANGYSIFLLKGFFDSLPPELYEAAELDGAGEWTKFWHLSMSLSRPILAVLALGAFTHAYSEFMMALVIIPDPDMWTIMVWLFQFQSTARPGEVYASLVVAAIPPMLVFLFCQNFIMRGIVVPSEK